MARLEDNAMNDPKNGLFPALACLQWTIAPGDIQANVDKVDDMLARHALLPDSLAILPELWATGFLDRKTAQAARETPRILACMQELARRYGIFLAGSLNAADEEGGPVKNMFYLVGPKGLLGQAGKQRLFVYGHEDEYYQPDMARGPIATPYGLLGAIICYDLRFPELARELAFSGCRILAVPTQWPAARLAHLQALARSRAIENQLFVAVANACGPAGPITLAGHSLILSPDGETLAEADADETCISAPVNGEAQQALRRAFCPPGERPWRCQNARKILTLAELLPRLKAVRGQGSRVAFTNGCFDLLHAGHVNYLEEARRTADCLVVGLNSDQSVRMQQKGPGRPVNTEEDRARVLAALAAVDFVVIFHEQTPLALIKAIQPEILVKGADWPEEKIVGAGEVKAAGGEVRRIALTEGRSTTALIAMIKKGSER